MLILYNSFILIIWSETLNELNLILLTAIIYSSFC